MSTLLATLILGTSLPPNLLLPPGSRSGLCKKEVAEEDRWWMNTFKEFATACGGLVKAKQEEKEDEMVTPLDAFLIATGMTAAGIFVGWVISGWYWPPREVQTPHRNPRVWSITVVRTAPWRY